MPAVSMFGRGLLVVQGWLGGPVVAAAYSFWAHEYYEMSICFAAFSYSAYE